MACVLAILLNQPNVVLGMAHSKANAVPEIHL
jgi:hypothetical protein